MSDGMAAAADQTPLLVDPRIGSGEFKAVLTDLGLPVQLTPLPFGDMAFLGNGPDGCPVPVGIERKALRDFIQSCRSERLQGHQLPGLHKLYQSVWIVIEGHWKVDWKTGKVVVPQGKQWVPLTVGSEVSGRELKGRIMTLRNKAGVHIQLTGTKGETARFITELYHWWCTDGWDKHGSHLGFPELSDSAMLTAYDRSNSRHLVRLFAKEMKGIGWEKSGGVMAAFQSPLDMAQASEKQWASIPGIGKTLAKRLMAALKGTVNGGLS